MGNEFTDRINEIHEEYKKGNVRSLILTGSDPAFSAGGDTSWLLERKNELPENNSKTMLNFYRSYLYIRSLPVPIIAAIKGPAIGAGLCLALACDIRITGFKSKLGLTFCSLGLHPGMGCTHFLPNIVGSENSKRLLFTADTISGVEALSIGLVSEAHEQDDVITRAGILAARIAQNSPLAVQQCVKTLRDTENLDLEKILQREADAQAMCYASKDFF
eukprot:CAMPEP_0171472340 /NCGR_PEP_ID=MMETSP0946-20130122/1217_1 /TAXON_ID=109269 /ORGANISM="Vaucheria litorea, Strain CCMP2940" /LENGTH=217 /DNA_ID=CAMNT_0012001953 /DNA_START=219 /DNA_END=869 /DNA_ORIENTATION=-